LGKDGWAKNVLGENRRKKRCLMETLDLHDRKAELTMLTSQEQEQKNYLNAELLREETYWVQRWKAMMVLNGDDNTNYFQSLWENYNSSAGTGGNHNRHTNLKTSL
jgi:hypothetical protein